MEAGDMTDNNAFEVDIVNDEDVSTSNIMTNSSGKICSTQLLDTSIEDARNKKVYKIL